MESRPFGTSAFDLKRFTLPPVLWKLPPQNDHRPPRLTWLPCQPKAAVDREKKQNTKSAQGPSYFEKVIPEGRGTSEWLERSKFQADLATACKSLSLKPRKGPLQEELPRQMVFSGGSILCGKDLWTKPATSPEKGKRTMNTECPRDRVPRDEATGRLACKGPLSENYTDKSTCTTSSTRTPRAAAPVTCSIAAPFFWGPGTSNSQRARARGFSGSRPQERPVPSTLDHSGSIGMMGGSNLRKGKPQVLVFGSIYQVPCWFPFFCSCRRQRERSKPPLAMFCLVWIPPPEKWNGSGVNSGIPLLWFHMLGTR